MGQVTAFPEAERIRVLAADSTSMSSQLLVEALSRDKRFEMLECVSTLADVVAVVQRSRAQIAVIGSRVADGSASGFELARELRSVSPSTRIII